MFSALMIVAAMGLGPVPALAAPPAVPAPSTVAALPSEALPAWLGALEAAPISGFDPLFASCPTSCAQCPPAQRFCCPQPSGCVACTSRPTPCVPF